MFFELKSKLNELPLNRRVKRRDRVPNYFYLYFKVRKVDICLANARSEPAHDTNPTIRIDDSNCAISKRNF